MGQSFLRSIGLLTLALCSTSCERARLPAFANPPPEDAAVNADRDAGSRDAADSEADAGPSAPRDG